MKAFRVILVLVVFLATAFAAEGVPATPAPPLLPPQFSGWQISGSPKMSNDPAVADPANTALLKEYGFTDFESAVYAREDGRKLTLKAARFADATGSYGAFTYY
jgi:hypothetical protein